MTDTMAVVVQTGPLTIFCFCWLVGTVWQDWIGLALLLAAYPPRGHLWCCPSPGF
jgi:hypothetical protein